MLREMVAKNYPLYLANRAVRTKSDLAVNDKYTNEVATSVSLADRAMIDQAIQKAFDARSAMARLPPFARQEVLAHATDRFRERSDELALALSIEAGKPVRDARGEVTRLIDTFRVASEEAVRVDGEALTLEISKRAVGYRGFTKRVPVGVCSFITPFNFPLNLVAHKIGPAIAAGCPFVLKPSERTPIGALIIAEVLAETSLPEGAFSVLPCRIEDSAPFIEDERIALLSFTGSSKVGWDLKARAGKKKVVLELGGNAACAVDEDQKSRLDHVVDRIISGAFYQSGQSCISVQRVYAHASLYAELRDKLVAKTKTLKMGDPKDEETFIGPMIDEAAAVRVETWMASAVASGARLLTGGTRKGAMLEPSLLDRVPANEPLAAEETFGPVAILESFVDFGECLARINASRFGLQAGIFTDSMSNALRAWDRLEVGGVIIGDVPSFRVDNMPYGGVKGSGLGREGVRYAIEEMTEPRLLVLRS
jgi:acyl-CoA reductase-like NAD-dependent aldehyde dehydrogenase